MNLKNNIWLKVSLFAVVLWACNGYKPDETHLPDAVKIALEKAGPNRSALLEVIEHYNKQPEDSLKLKSAYFLIENMDGWYYYRGELLDNYQNCLKLLRENPYNRVAITHYLDSMYGPFSFDKLDMEYDIRQITAEQLLGNIDFAFKAWMEQPWAKDYSFEQFCEYILPFRMGDEIPDYQREKIYYQYYSFLDSLRVSKGDPVAACAIINNELMKKGWTFTRGANFLPHIPASQLLEYQVGDCREQSDLGAYVMRSLGIPVSVDFVRQWPTRSQNHAFNAVITNKGKPIMFGTADVNPSVFNYAEMKKGKVYRYTYEKNKQSLALLKDEQEIIPGSFQNPHFRDVTDEYVPTLDIHIPLTNRNIYKDEYKHAYICVFNNKEWVPVHWGNIEKDSTLFTKMEGDIVYLPAYYDVNGVIPANYPFILGKNGELRFLIPDLKHPISSITIKRIFPILEDKSFPLRGGYFQGANTSDFKPATTLLEVSQLSRVFTFWNGIKIQSKDSFRFVRYYRPEYCGIGEMAFYAAGKKLSGSLFSSLSDTIKGSFSKENAIDGEIATSFFTHSPEGWVGLDLGSPQRIDSIRFAPGVSIYGPDYFIITGHKYEIRYWVDGHWRPIRSAIARESKVVFTNLPSNALFIVHDLSANVDERIFTIEHGTQTWW